MCMLQINPSEQLMGEKMQNDILSCQSGSDEKRNICTLMSKKRDCLRLRSLYPFIAYYIVRITWGKSRNERIQRKSILITGVVMYFYCSEK